MSDEAKKEAPACPKCGARNRFILWERREVGQLIQYNATTGQYEWSYTDEVGDDGDFIELRCRSCDAVVPEKLLDGWIG